MGKARFPKAERLLITADAGGSNGYRLKAWKVELARWRRDRARDHVCHYPPGLEVEQDRAPHVQLHLDELAGRPLVTYRTIVELIGSTTTTTGLRIEAEHDTKGYRTA